MLQIATLKDFIYRFLLEGQIMFIIWLKTILWTDGTCAVERLMFSVTQDSSFTHPKVWTSTQTVPLLSDPVSSGEAILQGA